MNKLHSTFGSKGQVLYILSFWDLRYECDAFDCTVRDKKMWIFIMSDFIKQNSSAAYFLVSVIWEIHLLLTFLSVLYGMSFTVVKRMDIFFDKLFIEHQ